MKRFLSLCLSLALLLAWGPGAQAAHQGLRFSLETAVYSISKESFVRESSDLASPDECGEDEFITLCVMISNPTGADVTLEELSVSIDGGEKLGWKSGSVVKSGQTARFHVYRANERYLTPGLHRATVYLGGRQVYTGRFNIGRAWSELFQMPTEAQIAARPADYRSPYLSSWLQIGSETRYDAYSIDFKSDHIPYATYSCLFNGHLDLSSLKEQYASVDSDASINLYGGLQRGGEGKGTNFILSFWDIHCVDKDGKETVIRPKRIYPAEETDNDSFDNEGTGAHTILPYEWKAGRWYRMLLQCGTSQTTGNTTVEQWFQDLETGEWTHTVTYDTGIKNSCLRGDTAIFSENFGPNYAGGVRSLEIANIRVHDLSNRQWRDVTSVRDIRHSTANAGAYGSWQAGADENTFYMISSGVAGLPGLGALANTGPLSVKNRESGDPLESSPPKETAPKPTFADVKDSDYFAQPVQWAVERGITTGTSETAFSPAAPCTQAQIITFLWRASGQPKPASATGGQYYASAAQWAKEQGMIDGDFSPDAPCTRAMAATYLWKQAGSPAAGAAGFTDVPDSASYCQAVAWAVERKITSGTGNGKFSPDSPCTRAQIMTFLYRALA